ncbi:ATP-binding cassette domain-containing protein [Occultella glacieicola]|uniref:ATP-binding cassette domain-containing protein n=1 Tax=Occultella glacieicola TaxID=2518684 RepID=A0ABY2E5E3_9MICO|nr:ATP-binding cassette domain-containing protein [Occultella glacieicola]TDE95789.1 ATP-binding cassette domain-containing protein [Occultella glacieicola]
MIEIDGLSKCFGKARAVDDLTVTIRPGLVTGFLGPNGAGKSTTMRMILGLDRPSAGRAHIDGHRYEELADPLRTVGAVLDARAGHPGQSARSHLLGVARSNGLARNRVTDVLETVGLEDVAAKRIGTFSLGMTQRLGIARALLGDPSVLLLDEPVNGLDPDGVLWIRGVMRTLAAEGRTVLVSSHLLSEMQDTADHLVIISRGRLVADESMSALLARRSAGAATVRSPHGPALATVLENAGMSVTIGADSVLQVTGADLDVIGTLAFDHGHRVDELTFRRPSLEEVYFDLTGAELEYTGRPIRTAVVAA